MWRLFEAGLHEDFTFDATNTISSTDFGRLVYTYAKTMNPISPLEPNVLQAATENLFASAYAVLTNAFLFQNDSSQPTFEGTSSSFSSRLFVYSPVAYTLIVLLAFLATCTIATLVYGRRPSILCEEPKGLLSYAGILHGSDINTRVTETRRQQDYDGRLRKWAEQPREVYMRSWKLDGLAPGTMNIVAA